MLFGLSSHQCHKPNKLFFFLNLYPPLVFSTQRMEAALFWIDCSMKKEHSFPQTASDQAPGGGESNREKCCPSPTGFLGFLNWNHSVKWRSSCQWQMAHMAGTGRILCSLEGPLISQYSRETPPENCKQILITHEEFSLLDVEVGTRRHSGT